MLEIACFSLQAAQMIANTNADRIEFCSGLEEGGLTPTLADFVQLKKDYTKPIYVMIRSRGGDFCYSNDEFLKMKMDIQSLARHGADGFVFGVLNSDGSLDIPRNKELVALAHGKPCTLHRAFDRGHDLEQNLKDAISCGFKTILTSGISPNVDQGMDNLAQLVREAGDSIEILVGGGLRSSNLEEIKNHTQAKNFHSSAILKGTTLPDFTEVEQLVSKLRD